jgi:5-methylcytosine-specific restriction endonuclease McrA
MVSQTPMTTKKRNRAPIPYDVQVRVLFRDGWICRWCRRPVVFGPALRLLQKFATEAGYSRPLAYYHRNWSRAGAPLLDYMGAVIDHVEAFAKGGDHGEANFVTACNKCNTRKNDHNPADWERENPPRLVRGKYGEPLHWDGLVSLFLVIAAQGAELGSSEKLWEKAIRKYFALEGPPNTYQPSGCQDDRSVPPPGEWAVPVK